MANHFQRVRALYRRPLRLGTTRISHDPTGTLVDLDDPTVRRDLYRHLGNWAVVGDKVVHKFNYNFADLGGAIGAITLTDDFGNAQKLPENALVLNAWLEGVTQPTSLGAATVALGVTGTAGLFKAATAKADASFAPDALSTAVAALPYKVTTSGGVDVKATVAAFALTAGELNLYVETIQGV